MSIASLCDRHTVDLYTRSESRGAAGSAAYTYALAATKRCFLQPASTRDRTIALQSGYEISHVAYFASDPSLRGGDEIRYGSRVLTVVGKPINAGEMGRYWRVEAMEQEQRQ